LTPEGVYLTYLQQTGSQIEVRGVAQSSTRVSAFMRNIDESAWLMSPSLRVVESKMAANTRGAEFTLFAKQRPQQTEEELAEGQPKKKKRVSAEPKTEEASS
jgi:type IV pilus assembly protein PilN